MESRSHAIKANDSSELLKWFRRRESITLTAKFHVHKERWGIEMAHGPFEKATSSSTEYLQLSDDQLASSKYSTVYVDE